ncbi:hypothetical protein EV363DRAFT_1160625, partial [Boletus edulis]
RWKKKRSMRQAARLAAASIVRLPPKSAWTCRCGLFRPVRVVPGTSDTCIVTVVEAQGRSGGAVTGHRSLAIAAASMDPVSLTFCVALGISGREGAILTKKGIWNDGDDHTPLPSASRSYGDKGPASMDMAMPRSVKADMVNRDRTDPSSSYGSEGDGGPGSDFGGSNIDTPKIPFLSWAVAHTASPAEFAIGSKLAVPVHHVGINYSNTGCGQSIEFRVRLGGRTKRVDRPKSLDRGSGRMIKRTEVCRNGIGGWEEDVSIYWCRKNTTSPRGQTMNKVHSWMQSSAQDSAHGTDAAFDGWCQD